MGLPATMPFHQWDYLFAIGTIFAALDAFNIGANDVANSFATSVASKSLTVKQATLAAAVMEFAGAVAVGARTADTIKNGIISSDIFEGNAGVQLLAFTCALVVSASWLMVCTRMSWPVSTTYSIVSAVAGVGVAVGGADSVNWGWNGGKGLATIFAGFLIAPAISAGFGAVLFLFVKFGVLRRKNPFPYALACGPLVFFLTAAVMTMSIVFKGSPSLGLDELPSNELAAAVVGTAAVVCALSVLFWVPYVYCKVARKDYTIRWYHFFFGPALWWRQPPADAQDSIANVVDYRVRADLDGEHHSNVKPQQAGAHADLASSGASNEEKIIEEPMSSGPVHESTLNRSRARGPSPRTCGSSCATRPSRGSSRRRLTASPTTSTPPRRAPPARLRRAVCRRSTPAPSSTRTRPRRASRSFRSSRRVSTALPTAPTTSRTPSALMRRSTRSGRRWRLRARRRPSPSGSSSPAPASSSSASPPTATTS